MTFSRKVPILQGLFTRLEDERRIRRRVLRLEFAHRLEVSRIGDNSRKFLELIQLCGAGGGWRVGVWQCSW